MEFKYKPSIDLLKKVLDNFSIHKEGNAKFCVCYRIHTNINDIIDHLINTLVAYDNIKIIIIISLPKTLYDTLSNSLKNIAHFIHFIYFDSYYGSKNKYGVTNSRGKT